MHEGYLQELNRREDKAWEAFYADYYVALCAYANKFLPYSFRCRRRGTGDMREDLGIRQQVCDDERTHVVCVQVCLHEHDVSFAN